MKMKDVKTLVGDDRSDLVGEVEAERDARHRIVDGDGYGRADPVKTRAVEVDIGATRRRKDPRFMTELLQTHGKVADVVVDASRRGEVVGRDQAYPHLEAPRLSRLIPSLPRCDAGRATGRDAAG